MTSRSRDERAADERLRVAAEAIALLAERVGQELRAEGGPAYPDQKERGESPKSELIVDVTRVLSNNDKEAMMLAARAIPTDYTDKLDRVEIALRPF